ncbi:MAG: fused MFS/spermidine synthase [Chloroflexi bacterium]|nr:fused MFS/spermidine synthase [Chloroflexota bacterium]
MIRLIALLLTILTGFTGLVYEVAWQRYLATLLGSHGEATAAVLGIFLGGLAVGYAVFGRATRWLVERARQRGRPVRLLSFYALVEAGIGVYALLFPLLFSAAQYLSLLGPIDHDALGFAFDVALSALLIGPPAVLMGGTIPILTLALAGDLEHATRVHAWIYGANTLGAFAGALAGGFFLVPLLGLDGVVLTMGVLNLVAAASFFLLERRAARIAPDLTQPAKAEPIPRFVAWAAVALLAGFAMMALQTTLNRLGALAFGSSQFTFAMVVAVFVLCIAIGSLAVSALPRIPAGLVLGCAWLLVALLFPLYFALADVTYWAHAIRVLFSRADPAFYAYHLVTFLAMLAFLAVPIGLSGALLPLLFHELRREVRDLGSVAGRLYAWNTLGSLLGALLGGYVLLFWLDLHHVYRIALAALIVGSAILTFVVLRPALRIVPALVALPTVMAPAFLMALAFLPPWPVDRLTAGTFRSREPQDASFLGPDEFFHRRRGLAGEVIFYDDDPTSTVSVWRPNGKPENLAIIVNGKSDGSLEGDYATMALAALVPALMAERHERCFVIGLGTGVTAGELASLDETREVTVAEISRGVIAANPLFDHGNLAASKNPKIQVKRGDAYRTLLRSQGDYDVIVSEPSNPWVTGVEMLYSREFLEAARSRLAPGGVFGQWFHVYETNVEVVKLVLRTYASVFPHVSVWFTLRGDLLLLGFDRPARALDVDALEERFGQPDFSAAFARVEIDSFPQLIAHELLPLGTLHAVEREGPVHTLRHPILSHLAARAFFPGGEQSALPLYVNEEHQNVSLRNSLLRRYGGVSDAYPEELLEAGARENCRFHRIKECVTFFARWAYDHPESTRRQAALAEMRRGARARQADLAPNEIGDVQRLFDRKFGASTLPYARVWELVSLYATHYNHAVPFDEDVLDDIWSRCQDLRCGTARRKVERMLEEGSWDLPPIAEKNAVTRVRRSPRDASPTTPDLSPESEIE